MEKRKGEPATTIDVVQQLLKTGRGEQIDWLDEHASTERIATSLMAMANQHGGKLIVGLKDDDQPDVLGVNQRNATVDRIIEAAMSLTPALLIPVPKTTHIAEKEVVIADIPQQMPYVYSMDGRYFHRKGTKNIVMHPRDLHQLLIQRGGISFETEIVSGATLDDIDWEKVDLYAKSISHNDGDRQQLLYRRGCLAMLNDTLYPTNAGILLFGKEAQRFIHGSEITAVRFAGNVMGDTFNRQDILGTLPDQIRKAATFLTDYLRKGVQLKSTMARQEEYEYPMEAVRELVVNAVAHRDYSIRGDGIRLFIFKDRMEIHSAGRLPGPVTVANIKDERFSRNPVIVQILSDMGFIERLGYGVDRVIELMKSQSLREPEFSETSGGFRVVLHNQKTEISAEAGDLTETDEKVEVLRSYADIPLNPRQEEAIFYLNRPDKTRITNSELQRLFPEVHAETIRRDLADLVTKNIVSKMGQKRGSYYVLKHDGDVDDSSDETE